MTPARPRGYGPAVRTLVVTPTYNERENIATLIEGLRDADPSIEVLVVDDGSPDGTADLAEELGAHVLRRPGKAGLASAYTDGFRRALDDGADRVVQMDADLSHSPADVPRLLAPGTGLALGSRYVPGGGTKGWPLHRKALSRFGSAYARLWLGMPYRDLTGGFKAWRADLLRQVIARPVRSTGYAFQVEMTARAVRLGAEVTEVPIIFTERARGNSKMSTAIALEAARIVPTLRFRR